jgi:Aspartyl protease
MAGQNYHGFTLTATGRLRVLRTTCHACQAFDPRTVPQQQHPPYSQFQAIWDTGATGSVITQDVVNTCGLKPIGMVKVQSANGVADTETYLVNLRLPNNVTIPNVTVTRADLGANVQILIGMDIITLGDFAITNAGGKTMFSFRAPSMRHIDFQTETMQAVQAAQSHKPPPPPTKFQPSAPRKKRKRR